MQYGTSKKCADDIKRVPVLQITNVAKGRIDIDDVKIVIMTDKELGGLKLSKGYLLIIRSNASKLLVGRTVTAVRAERGAVPKKATKNQNSGRKGPLKHSVRAAAE